MKANSIAFQIWHRNIKFGGYMAAFAVVSFVLSVWLTSYSVQIAVVSSICGLISFLLSAIQVRTKGNFGFLHTMFSVFAMLLAGEKFAPPDHRADAIWQFGSVYVGVWFGLVFLFRRALMRRLEATYAV